jgi:DNA polymerase-3 subunit epsilon
MKTPLDSDPQDREILITRPLTFVDLETTGSILGLDRIVEVGAVKIMPDGSELTFETRVNPEMEIIAEATRIHGITNADVHNSRTFGAIGPGLLEFLQDSDLAGYNILNFDLPMLEAEFQRIGLPLQMTGRRVIDVMDIFVHKEPRDLKTAYRFYCGSEYRGAHSAMADARACLHVLRGEVNRYKDMPNTAEGISSYVAQHRKKKALDTGGWFISRNGKPALARGKYQGMLIREIAESDPDYLGWMMSLGLPKDTVDVIRGVVPNIDK